jgi:hypothetical protein
MRRRIINSGRQRDNLVRIDVFVTIIMVPNVIHVDRLCNAGNLVYVFRVVEKIRIPPNRLSAALEVNVINVQKARQLLLSIELLKTFDSRVW